MSIAEKIAVHATADAPTRRPMNPYAAAYAHFREQTEGHVLTVLHDDGLYRHLRMRTPSFGTIWSWNVVTWPGVLATAGDIADGYMFSRIDDMISFFDGTGSHGYYSDGAPSIDFRYWAEKLRGGRYLEVRTYSKKVFVDTVREHLEEDDELGTAAEIEYQKIERVAESVCRRHGVNFHDYLRDLREDHGRRYGDLEVDPDNREEIEYLGLPLPQLSPAQRRTRIIDDAAGHAEDERSAHDWLHRQFPDQDTWEWDLRDFDVHFLYACWAIDKTVQLLRSIHPANLG